LLEEFSWESIDECTRAKNEVDRQVFRDAFHRYAKENNLYQESIEESQGSLDILFNFDAENAEHKEVLFKLKLKIFEQESVKNSKKRKAKTEIRKAENPVEAIRAYATLL
jgi:response regulator of citrate/malate metabolism